MKGYNHIMSQLLSAISSSDSLWAIIPPLVTLAVLLVILPKCLLTFVQSWSQGKKSKQISMLLVQTLEQSLMILLKNLKSQSETVQPNEELKTVSKPEAQQAQQPQQYSQELLKLANKLAEVIKNEEY